MKRATPKQISWARWHSIYYVRHTEWPTPEVAKEVSEIMEHAWSSGYNAGTRRKPKGIK